MKKYILGSKSTYWYILGVKSMYQYILVYVGLYRYHTIAWYIPVHTGTYWYELGTYHWSGFQMAGGGGPGRIGGSGPGGGGGPSRCARFRLPGPQGR